MTSGARNWESLSSSQISARVPSPLGSRAAASRTDGVGKWKGQESSRATTGDTLPFLLWGVTCPGVSSSLNVVWTLPSRGRSLHVHSSHSAKTEHGTQDYPEVTRHTLAVLRCCNRLRCVHTTLQLLQTTPNTTFMHHYLEITEGVRPAARSDQLIP